MEVKQQMTGCIILHHFELCFSFWDVRTMTEFKTIQTGHAVSSMEIHRDGTILTVTYGKEVSFWDTSRYYSHRKSD